MAQPADTFSSFAAIGIREDLSNIIYNVDPEETPFISSIARVAATQRLHEWQTDVIPSISDNAHIEGDDTVATAATPSVRLTNRTRISKRSPRVTGSVRAFTTAGRADEFDYQLILHGKALRRDMGNACIGLNQAIVVGSDVAAAKNASVLGYINSNTSAGGGGSDPAGTGADARTDGTQRPFTETLLKSVLSSVFTSSGKRDHTLMVGPFNKQAASAFTGGATKFDRSEDGKLTAMIDVYFGDFGRVDIVPNDVQRERDAFLFDFEFWALATVPGRDMQKEPLAKTGDSDITQLLTEFTLEARNEKSSGGVFDLDTS